MLTAWSIRAIHPPELCDWLRDAQVTPSEPEKVSKTVTGILDLNLLPDLTLIRYKIKSPCIRSVTTGPILSENRTNIEKTAAK